MNRPSAHPPPPTATSIEKRLRRIESRLVQLMIHMGLNPYAKTYEGDEAPEVSRQPEKRETPNGH